MIALKNILVATDFSEPSAVALDYGRNLARSYDATLHVVHVIEESLALHGPEIGFAYADIQRNIEAAVRRDLDAALSADDRRTLNARTVITRAGNVSHAITEYAKNNAIDLIIVGTHGRGIYIADISGLQALTPGVMAAEAHLVPIVPAVQHATGLRPFVASLNYNGQSRLPGVHINYYLKGPASGVTVRVYDGARVIAETTTAPGNAGLNTVRWTMQSARPMTEAEQQAAGRGRGGRGGGGFGGGRGAGAPPATPQFPAQAQNTVLSIVQPGEYRVVLNVGGREYSQTALVMAER